MTWRRGQALDQDLRDRVLAAHGSAAAVAERFGVSPSYVDKARRRQRELGALTPGAQRNHVPRKLAELDAAIAARMTADAHQTIEQLRDWVAREHGVRVAHATMYKALCRLGLTRKK